MRFQYQSYERNSLKKEPKKQVLDQWRVEYLAFANPGDEEKVPLIVLGGAFQNFNSYKLCVERILVDSPVILVDLPSLGSNDQLAPELGMEDLADLLYKFVCHMGIPKVSIMGLSLGSVLASTYAYKYPDWTHKLIVAGIVPKPRRAWRMQMEESVNGLNDSRMDELGQAIVLSLMNYTRLKETGITSIARRLFYRQVKRFTSNEQARYKINTARLLEVEGILGYPKCEALVTTGEFDSFTLPYENAQFASKCPNATFVLIENADHLPQLERRDESLELFASFLSKGAEGLKDLEGIRVLNKHECDNLEKRSSVRYVPCNPSAKVASKSLLGESYSFNQKVRVSNINFFGCLLQLETPNLSLAEHARDLTLHMVSPDISLELLVFEHDEDGLMRCLFKHGNIAKAEKFIEHLNDNEIFIEMSADAEEVSVRKIY